MNKITGIEINYFYNNQDESHHVGYFDTFEEAINFLESESKEKSQKKRKQLNNFRNEVYDIEEELFKNGLSDIRKAQLLRRRDELFAKIESLLLSH